MESQAACLLFTYGVVERNRNMLRSAAMEEVEEMERILSELRAVYPIIYENITSDDVKRSYGVKGCLRTLRMNAYDVEDMVASYQWSMKVGDPDFRTMYSNNLGNLTTRLRQSVSELLKICDIVEHDRTADPQSTFVIHPDPLSALSTKVTGSSSRYYGVLWSLPEDSVVGREAEKKQIIQWMFNTYQYLPLNVIAIRGKAGIGKTTLVKMVYNEAVQVQARFSLLLWALAPRSPRSLVLKGIFIEIIRSFTNQSWFDLQRMDMGKLKDTLRNILERQKYLLVLDDYEGEKLEEWEELRKILEVGLPGSTVIVVTEEYGSVNASKTLALEGLGDDKCWSLFARSAGFDEEAEQKHPSFLTIIGKAVVKNCYRCPLAIKTLGSMLSTNRDEHSWKQIQESKIWNSLTTYERNTAARTAFKISLEHMSCDLLQCLYLSSILWKYKVVPKDQLVFFWMALGLLHSRDGNEDPIHIGNRFCNELESRCFIQLFQSDGHPMVSVHKQVASLHTMREEVNFVPSRICIPRTCRHLIWDGDDSSSDKDLTPHYDIVTVRTFLFQKWIRKYKGPHRSKRWYSVEMLITKLKNVRVLLLDGFEFEELLSSIEDLKLLTYLSFAGNRMLIKVPDKVCKLLNLQTLDLSGCEQLQTLPRNMQNLVSLRHLFLSLKLTNIPELALKSWTSLHHLKICNSPNLNSLSESIAHLTALKVLQIHDCPSIASLPNSINCLTSLNEISILNCPVLDLTNWDGLDGLRGLQLLQIQGLPKLTKLPEGLTDSLRHLVVSTCQSLIALSECLQNSMNLLEMVIDNCPNLTTLPKGIQEIKTLQVLKIVNCPKLIARCQRRVEDDWHLISHIPNIQLLQHQAYKNRAVSASKDHPANEERKPMLHGPEPHRRPTKSSLVASAVSHEQISDVQEVDVEKEVEWLKAGASSSQALSKGKVGFTRGSMMEETKDPRSILFLLPDDYEIEKDTLIQLWMAAGHIKDEPMELHGEECFRTHNKYLLHCGTNFMTGKDRYRINTEKINELLDSQKDNASYCLKWKKECQKNLTLAEFVQHVSLGCSTEIDATTFQTLEKFTQLRTLLFLGNHGHKAIRMPSYLFSSLNKLQTLDLSRTNMKEIPGSIGHMIHLRYLDLSWTLIKWLPDIICSLAELQTLKLKGCSNLLKLPTQLKRLTKLRHLDVDVLRQPELMPKGIGELVHLRTLSAFLVGTEYGSELQELKELDNIAGNLCIANLENVKDAEEASEAALQKKQKLQHLELRWTASEICGTHHNSHAVLEFLQPNTSLEELQILCYEGTTFPFWISCPMFNKLVSIVFDRCENIRELPLIEQLPVLKHLELAGMNSVLRICRHPGELHGRDVAFPKLEKLEISEMQSLEVWDWKKKNEHDFMSLTHLIIDDCPELHEFDVLPHLFAIKHLEIRDCPKLLSLSDRKLPDSLEELIVEDCPHIQLKCLEGEGEDWPKIEHVPNKSILE